MQMGQEMPPIFFEAQPSTSAQKSSQMSSAQVRQVLAQALIERLHNWCMHLFWMTVLCVINCCGDEQGSKKSQKPVKTQESRKPKTSITEIEQKLLRHLTSPYLASPLRPVQRPTKKRVLSRPPSPQLFDIAEEE